MSRKREERRAVVVRIGRGGPRPEQCAASAWALGHTLSLSPSRDRPYGKCQKLVRGEGTYQCYLYLLFPETKSQ